MNALTRSSLPTGRRRWRLKLLFLLLGLVLSEAIRGDLTVQLGGIQIRLCRAEHGILSAWFPRPMLRE